MAPPMPTGCHVAGPRQHGPCSAHGRPAAAGAAATVQLCRYCSALAGPQPPASQRRKVSARGSSLARKLRVALGPGDAAGLLMPSLSRGHRWPPGRAHRFFTRDAATSHFALRRGGVVRRRFIRRASVRPAYAKQIYGQQSMGSCAGTPGLERLCVRTLRRGWLGTSARFSDLLVK